MIVEFDSYDFCFVNELNLKTGNFCRHLLPHHDSLTTFVLYRDDVSKRAAFHFPVFGQNRPC